MECQVRFMVVCFGPVPGLDTSLSHLKQTQSLGGRYEILGFFLGVDQSGGGGTFSHAPLALRRRPESRSAASRRDFRSSRLGTGTDHS